MSGLSQLGGNSPYYPNDSALAIDTDLSMSGSMNLQSGPHSRQVGQVAPCQKADYGIQKKGYLFLLNDFNLNHCLKNILI